MGHPLAKILKSFAALRHSTLVFILLAFAVPLGAQTTAVTGTVTDTNGLPYAGGTLKAQLVLAGAGVNGQPTVTVTGVQACRSSGFGSSPCQVPFQGTVGPITLDTTGSFSLSLQDNALVTPASTQWLFSVTISPGVAPPLGTGPQSCSASLTITGASQSVSSSLKSCPRLSNSAGAIPNTPTPPALAQGPTFNFKNYGAIGDAQHILDGVTAGGAAKTLTSATGAFKSTDVGKFVACNNPSGQIIIVGTKINGFTSATAVTIDTNDFGAASGLRCVWYTQEDGAAIRAAILAATPSPPSRDPNIGATIGNSGGSAYCPEGGYAVTVNATVGALLTFAGSGNSIAPYVIGAGKAKCIIYPLANSTDTGGPVIFNLFNSGQTVMGGFSIEGQGFPFTWTHPILGWTSVQHSRMYSIEITNIGANLANQGTLDFFNSTDIIVEDVFVQGGVVGANDFACGFFGVSSSKFLNLVCSNHNQTAFFGSGGGTLRGTAGDNAPIIEDSTFDECGASGVGCTVFTAGYANFIGGWIGVGNPGQSMSIDGTSKVWMSFVNCGQFGAAATVSGCATLAAGGRLYVTGSTLRANNTGVIFTGPSTAFVFDLGGNDYVNCNGGVCTPATAAQSFTGGIFATFPLPPNALTQLGGRQTVSGTAPTFGVTGFGGAGLVVTVETGSTDAAGSVTITAGAAPAAVGTFTLTFTTTNGAYGTNPPVCTFTLVNGTGTWNALAQQPVIQTKATTAVTANWANNAVALTAASTYGFNWSCYGK